MPATHLGTAEITWEETTEALLTLGRLGTCNAVVKLKY